MITPLEKYNDILRLKNEGKSLSEIGEIHNISRAVVWLRIRYGLPKKVYSKDCPDPFKKILPKWKTSGREYVRGLVRARDNHQCQVCGKSNSKKGRSLDVHHLNGLCGKKSMGYDKKSEMGTLITLCHKCHYNRHDFSVRLKTKTKKRPH